MQFRLCCTCDDKEKVKTTTAVENNGNSAQTGTTSKTVTSTTSTVITQQPKNVFEPIQLDRITEVSVEESSVQAREEEQPQIEKPILQQSPIQGPPIPVPRIVEMKQDINTLSDIKEDPRIPPTGSKTKDELYAKLLNLLEAEGVKGNYTPPDTQSQSHQTPNVNVETTIGGEKISLIQIASDLFRGTFKGCLFYIINGNIQEAHSAFGESDKAAIQVVYNMVMESMQLGVKEMAGTVTSLSGQGQSNSNSSHGIQTSKTTEMDALCAELVNVLKAKHSEEKYTPPVAQSYSEANQTPNISFDTTIDGEKMSFIQIAPDFYQGTFKGHSVHIINGRIIDDYSALDVSDKAAIKVVYNRVMEGMQLGAKELAGKVTALRGQEQTDWSSSLISTINTDYITRSGKNAVMTFVAIGPNRFRSTYEGKEFTILNGQLLTTDEKFDEQDRELILKTFKNTLVGMEQGLLGMQKGMLGARMGIESMQMNIIGGSAFAGTTIQGGTVSVSSVAVGGNVSAYGRTEIGGSTYASANGGAAMAYAGTLTSGRETLKRMRSLNHGKRISLLDGGLMAQPRQPVMVIEDITEQYKKSRYFDDVDESKLVEPVLQKTTFTPEAIIYDDPKTYEEQDKNELPVAKQLDEYIISVDENFNSENRYHFHKARPKRVIRGKLNPKEKLRLASPERYSLFEGECLKLHNHYRKMHGVPPLVHNEFLSQVAKEWAEHLALKDAFYHRPKNEYGENLYYIEGTPCRAKMAVKAWYDEIDLYDYDNPKFSREVGHFTQLVWKDTREVGTGVAQIGDKIWVCCNYHPPGNYLDKLNDDFVPRPLMKRVKKN